MLRGLRARSGTFVAAPVTVTSALASGANAARSTAVSATTCITSMSPMVVKNKLRTGLNDQDSNADCNSAALSVSRTQRLLHPARAGGSWWCFHSVGRRVRCHDSHDDTR